MSPSAPASRERMVYSGNDGSPNGSTDVVVVLLGATVEVVVDSAAWMLVTGDSEVDDVVVDVPSVSSPEQPVSISATASTHLETERNFTGESYRAFAIAHDVAPGFYERWSASHSSKVTSSIQRSPVTTRNRSCTSS